MFFFQLTSFHWRGFSFDNNICNLSDFFEFTHLIHHVSVDCVFRQVKQPSIFGTIVFFESLRKEGLQGLGIIQQISFQTNSTQWKCIYWQKLWIVTPFNNGDCC